MAASAGKTPETTCEDKEYDVGFHTNVDLEVVYCLLRAAECTQILSKPVDFDETPEFLVAFKEKNVLLCGTYYTPEDIARAKKLSKSLTIFCPGQKDTAVKTYGSVEGIRYVDVFDSMDVECHRWINHCVRRTSAGALPEDEYFYRGVIFGKPNVADAFRSLIKGPKRQYKKFIEVGRVVDSVYKQLGKDCVEYNSKIITCGPGGQYSCRITVGATSPVVPVVRAVAEGVDLGVIIRPLVNGKTAMTFFTYHPEIVSLAFVHNEPYNGGGSPECADCTLDCSMDFNFLYTSLEDMVRASVEKS